VASQPQRIEPSLSASNVPYISPAPAPETRDYATGSGNLEITYSSDIALDTKAPVPMRSARLKKIWAIVSSMFVIISGLSVALTGDARTVFVVAAVSFALGGLGSLMALVSTDKSATA
jgi:hypothetical protein